tara:strand:- start:1176 stop:1667 length:492 start_codon:yes stop_codon:yes gene_type:complete
MTPEREYLNCYKRMAEICEEQGWGDPFSYARSKEIYAAIKLGHKIADTYSGADAFCQQGTPLEYKSTIQDKVQGSYTGISVQDTWKEQEKYLKEEKILPYEHFYNRFKNGKLVESWSMSGEKVLQILLPKLKKAYPSVLKKKDPRLSANVTWAEIQKHGKKVI